MVLVIYSTAQVFLGLSPASCPVVLCVPPAVKFTAFMLKSDSKCEETEASTAAAVGNMQQIRTSNICPLTENLLHDERVTVKM